jgi:plastocyanin
VRRHPVGIRIRPLATALVVTLLLGSCAIGMADTGSAGVDITVATAPGEQLGFIPGDLHVPAGVPVHMTFRNASSVAHNLVFTSGITAATKTIVDPGTTEELALATPGPGVYEFVCTIHDGMSGMLTVEAVAANG